ncbi:MAG: AtpZ/AtpI family protein [Chitinophagales bacterium]|nr:AtpZ/AtpI family protein [Chitinophagales bacterium]
MPKPQKQQKPDQGNNRKKVDAYLKYSGMAFQMGIIILVGTYAGKKLDEYFQSDQPIFTVVLALLSIFAALYISLKDLFISKDK